MKTFGTSCLLLTCVCLPARAADQAQAKKVAKAKTQEINDALIKEDFGKIADLTHRTVVKMMGGRDKMIAVMKAGVKDMKSRGVSFRTVKVGEPSDLVAAGTDLYVVVPFRLELTIPGKRALQNSFVIGVSGDGGKTWSFVNGDLDDKRLKLVLPNLPPALKLPKRERPTIQKD
jgi:hypothetical protein